MRAVCQHAAAVKAANDPDSIGANIQRNYEYIMYIYSCIYVCSDWRHRGSVLKALAQFPEDSAGRRKNPCSPSGWLIILW